MLCEKLPIEKETADKWQQANGGKYYENKKWQQGEFYKSYETSLIYVPDTENMQFESLQEDLFKN